MQVCSKKFKVRNAAEALFVANMVERIKEVTTQYNLPINHIRFGRQVKSWGSTGVASYHVYRYNSDKNKIELWVNGHDADLSEDGRKYLEYCAILGCLTWDKINKDVNVDAADVTAFALKYRYKDNGKLAKYLAKRVAADKIAGTNFAFTEVEVDKAKRDVELDAIVAALEAE